MSENKPREFWIQQGTPDVVCDSALELVGCVDDWRLENIPHYHVIEYSAHTTALDIINKMQAGLEYYANGNHYASGDYDVHYDGIVEDHIIGKTARSTLAETSKLLEKLKGE